MNCLIGKDFTGDGCCCPAASLAVMGGHRVSVITNMPTTQWQNRNVNCAKIKEERLKKQKHLDEYGLQSLPRLAGTECPL